MFGFHIIKEVVGVWIILFPLKGNMKKKSKNLIFNVET
jgi:hypothetical protein